MTTPGGDSKELERQAVSEEIAGRDAIDPPGDPVDGGEPSQPIGDPPPADGPKPVETAKAKPEFEEDPVRAAILASAKANRGKTIEDFEAEAHAEATGEIPAESTQGQPGVEPPAPAPKLAQVDDDALVTIKVNGVDKQIPYSELRATAQKNLAADDALAAAKLARDDAEALLARARTQPPAQPVATPATGEQRQTAKPGDPPRPTTVDEAQLADIADRIQAGTREEATAALVDFAKTVVANAGPNQPVDVRAAVREILVEDERGKELSRALDAVAKDFPDLVKEEPLAKPTLDAFVGTVVKELRAIGVPEAELTDPSVTISQLVRGHQRLRADPQYAPQLRDIPAIAREAAQTINDRYVAPRLAATQPRPGQQQTRVAPTAARTERKEQQVSSQPRPTSGGRDMGDLGRPQQRRDPSSVVQRIAQERGQIAAP